MEKNIINFVEKKKEKEEESALIKRLEQREKSEVYVKLTIEKISEAGLLDLIGLLKERGADYKIEQVEERRKL